VKTMNEQEFKKLKSKISEKPKKVVTEFVLNFDEINSEFIKRSKKHFELNKDQKVYYFDRKEQLVKYLISLQTLKKLKT